MVKSDAKQNEIAATLSGLLDNEVKSGMEKGSAGSKRIEAVLRKVEVTRAINMITAVDKAKVINDEAFYAMLRNLDDTLTDEDWRKVLEEAYFQKTWGSKEEMKTTSFRFPVSLQLEMKEYCARHGMKLAELFEKAMRDYMKRNP